PNDAPQGTIITPIAGATFAAGDTISYSGRGSDREDGDVPAARTAWWVERLRGSETQLLVPRTVGARSGLLGVPTRGEVWPEMRYRLHLEVTDRAGRADTVVRELAPRTSTLRVATDPAGLQVTVDGTTTVGPREVLSVVGALHD